MDQVEYNNIMIGAIMNAINSISNVSLQTLTASQWKRSMYFEEGMSHMDWFPEAQEIHSGDAGCMALYSMWRNRLIEWPGFNYPKI
jgi:hypothetical protein